jgi:hypothetical protein
VTASWRQELRDFLLIAVYVALTGPIVGLLWSAVSPKLDILGLVSGSGTFRPEIGADVHFGLLGIGAGAVCAAITLACRRDGPGSMIGLAIGGLGAALIADRVGYLLNHGDTVALLRAHSLSLTIDPFFKVRALGVVVAWPMAALVVYVSALALRDRARSLP